MVKLASGQPSPWKIGRTYHMPRPSLHSVLEVDALNPCQFPNIPFSLDSKFLQMLPFHLECHLLPFISPLS